VLGELTCWEKEQEEELQQTVKHDEWATQRLLLQACLVLGSIRMAGRMQLLLLPEFDPFAKLSVVVHNPLSSSVWHILRCRLLYCDECVYGGILLAYSLMPLTFTDTPGGRHSLLLYMLGIVLFLLHLVPGMPIYLASAVLLLAQGQKKGADTSWRYLVIAVVLGMVAKLLIVALQQKLIGYRFLESDAIKKTIGVQASVMKAAKQVLKRPGLDFHKVCVLVSGPDWSSSVFPGVLNLPLIQMLIGTTPVFFLILPVVVSGVFMARVGTTVEEMISTPLQQTSHI